MKFINLLFFLLVVNLSFGQWTSSEYRYGQTFCDMDIAGIAASPGNKLFMFNDSTGARKMSGNFSPSTSFVGSRTICNYGVTPMSDPNYPEWNCGGIKETFWPGTGNRFNFQFLNEDMMLYVMEDFFNYDHRIFNRGCCPATLFTWSPKIWPIPVGIGGINDYNFLNVNTGLINVSDTTTDLLIKYNSGVLDTIYIVPNSFSSNVEFVTDSLVFLQQDDLTLNKKRLMKSIDAGQNWTPVFDSLTADLKEIDFVSENIGFISLSNDTIFKTIDKGASWNFVAIDYNRFQGVYDFVADNLWYAVASSDSLFKTYNQGQTWIYDSLIVTNIQDIEIRNDSLGYVIGTDCKLYVKNKTTNIDNTSINKEVNSIGDISIYPNPANNFLSLKNVTKDKVQLIQVFNVNGKLLLEKKNTKSINISNISSSIYILKVKYNGETSYYKFIKN